MHRMSDDGMKLLDEGVEIINGEGRHPHLEGPKVERRNGYVYVHAPGGGVASGWQVCYRSKGIEGPFEEKIVLSEGASGINGPHQGGMVDDADGKTWFMHFQQRGGFGRIVHLQPVEWEDNWPVIGNRGEPVHEYSYPGGFNNEKRVKNNNSDSLKKASLGRQWQWNHNPDDKNWRLDKNRGLRLDSLKAESFLGARNHLTQKLRGPRSEVSVLLDGSNLKSGSRAGLSLFSTSWAWVGLRNIKGSLFISLEWDYKSAPEDLLGTENLLDSILASCSSDSPVVLNAEMDKEGFVSFSARQDKREFVFVHLFRPVFGWWKGARWGLFSYNENRKSGFAEFSKFTEKQVL